MSKALYAFSGDPITYGHIDIVERAARVFDELIVAVGNNPQKHYLFSQEERFDMAKVALAHLPKVKVFAFDGLLIDFAYEQAVDVIVKGIRSHEDLNYEQNLHLLGESQKIAVDTFLLLTRPSLQHVSSSAVKDLQKEQGFIQEYVPLYVKQKLEAKLSQQYLVGITGEIGVGKSYLGDALTRLARERGIPAFHIELDEIARQIQSDLKQNQYALLRQQIIEDFALSPNPKGEIDRKLLGEIVFADRKKLEHLNQLMRTAILVRLRKELKGKKGVIFLNAALLAESHMLDLVNNNLILVKNDEATQSQHLRDRGFHSEQIKRRLQSQYNFQGKKRHIQAAIRESGQGKIWFLENDETLSSAQQANALKKILSSILEELTVTIPEK
jgi:pantetheine-phosphate adenylyltransferase